MTPLRRCGVTSLGGEVGCCRPEGHPGDHCVHPAGHLTGTPGRVVGSHGRTAGDRIVHSRRPGAIETRTELIPPKESDE